MKTDKSKYLKAGLVAAALSAVMLLFTYVYWNLTYTYGYGDSMIVKISKKRDLYVGHKFDDSKILPVNVAYDKILVPHIDVRDESEAGVIPITDRGKLLTFLKMLKERDKYGFILCDVRFDEHSTEYDEELFALIASMRNIVVACDDVDDAPEAIAHKAAKATYKSRNVGDSFMKYDFVFPDGEHSMALRMWEEITGKSINKKWWGGYTSEGKICVRSCVPDFRYSIYDDITDAGEREVENSYMYSTKIYNLGAQVVQPYIEGLSSGKLYDGKFIIIGDLTENDKHSTIVGNQPGSIVVFNALLSLMHEDHIIPFWVYLLLFIIFWIESMFLIRKQFNLEFRLLRPFRKLRVWVYRRRKVKTREVLHIGLYKLLDFVGYSTPLWLVALLIYAVSGVFVNALIIGTVFWTISWFL